VLVQSANEKRAEAGEIVVHRWQATREFYVIVSGAIEICGPDGESLRELGPGGFFGELAALDWGAGFGYARTAEVVARSPTRLLVLTASSLAEVLRRAPTVETVLRATARERLREL
jgi:CRP-like cAMP-binding protein